MGKVIYPRKGEVHTEPVNYPAFADATWEQVIEVCQTNTVPETWVVGDQKSLTINGSDYLIDIIGKNHDTYTAGGTAPLTFQMHDCYGTQYQMYSSATNSCGWTNSSMRKTTLPAILAQMPSNVQASIREVNKLTSAGNQSAVINATSDKLFLLSEIEVFGGISLSKSGEGSQYAYYAAGNSKVKTLNNVAGVWWERSPGSSNSRGFCSVSATGTQTAFEAQVTARVAFAFCF